MYTKSVYFFTVIVVKQLGDVHDFLKDNLTFVVGVYNKNSNCTAQRFCAYKCETLVMSTEFTVVILVVFNRIP